MNHFLKKILFGFSRQAAGILIAGLAISITAFFFSIEEQDSEWAEQLRQEALEDTLILVGKLEFAEGEVMGILSLFRSMGEVKQEGFKSYTESILTRSKFIDKFEWAPRIYHEKKSLFIIRAKRKNNQNYDILEKNSEGKWVHSGDRSEYFPVYYSVSKRSSLLGRDLSSVKLWSEAMSNARDLGGLTSNAELSADNETLIHLFAPHYDADIVPKNLQERKKLFQGVIHGVYPMNKMMSEMVLPYLAKGMNLTVILGNEVDQNKIIYGSLWEDAALEIKIPVVFANKRWLLIWQGNKNFLGGPDRSQAYWYAGTLFGGTCFIVAIFQILATRTRQVEKLVEVRTDELMKSNQELKQEVSARIQAENELVAARDGAEAANRAKSSFLANMSHEIRTPMNAILGYAQILLTTDFDKGKARTYVAHILKSGDHLLKIINDILDISKIEAGRLELKKNDFDLNRLLDEVESIILPKAGKKNLEWNKDGIGKGPRMVFGDETKLKQTLINLLDNAVKFTDSGKIEVRAKELEENIYSFEVEDTGRGISKGFLEKIFHPFQQEIQESHRGGAGLGLAIARKHTQLMGSELLCESTPDKGTRFFFEIELEPGREEESFAAIGDEILMRNSAGDPVKILVVDDDPMSRDVLEKILEYAGASVDVSENGFQALAYLQDKSPQLIFMDMRMPGMTGLETISKIREQFSELQSKIIGVSASALDNERLYYLENGCEAFIPKPFRSQDILNCASQLLGIKRSAPIEEPESLQFSLEGLPDGLTEKIRQSAELHNITGLKQLFLELEACGESGRRLKKRLDPMLARYDMKEIVKALSGLNNKSD